MSNAVIDAMSSEIERLREQVQKLTEENERLRQSYELKVDDLRRETLRVGRIVEAVRFACGNARSPRQNVRGPIGEAGIGWIAALEMVDQRLSSALAPKPVTESTGHDESDCPCDGGWIASPGCDPGGFDAVECQCPCHAALSESHRGEGHVSEEREFDARRVLADDGFGPGMSHKMLDLIDTAESQRDTLRTALIEAQSWIGQWGFGGYRQEVADRIREALEASK